MMSKSSLRTVALATVKRKFLNGFRQSRLLGFCSLMLLSIFLLPDSVFAQLSGSGTQTDPYKITSASDLVYLSNNAGTLSTIKNNTLVYFKMTNDIDMSTYKGNNKYAVIVKKTISIDVYKDKQQNGNVITWKTLDETINYDRIEILKSDLTNGINVAFSRACGDPESSTFQFSNISDTV